MHKKQNTAALWDAPRQVQKFLLLFLEREEEEKKTIILYIILEQKVHWHTPCLAGFGWSATKCSEPNRRVSMYIMIAWLYFYIRVTCAEFFFSGCSENKCTLLHLGDDASHILKMLQQNEVCCTSCAAVAKDEKSYLKKRLLHQMWNLKYFIKTMQFFKTTRATRAQHKMSRNADQRFSRARSKNKRIIEFWVKLLITLNINQIMKKIVS